MAEKDEREGNLTCPWAAPPKAGQEGIVAKAHCMHGCPREDSAAACGKQQRAHRVCAGQGAGGEAQDCVQVAVCPQRAAAAKRHGSGRAGSQASVLHSWLRA